MCWACWRAVENGWIDRDALGMKICVGRRSHVFDEGAHWRVATRQIRLNGLCCSAVVMRAVATITVVACFFFSKNATANGHLFQQTVRIVLDTRVARGAVIPTYRWAKQHQHRTAARDIINSYFATAADAWRLAGYAAHYVASSEKPVAK